MVQKSFVGYNHIGVKKGVCGGEPIILGTRLEPKRIVKYGTKNEIIEDFGLTIEQVEECYRFINDSLVKN